MYFINILICDNTTIINISQSQNIKYFQIVDMLVDKKVSTYKLKNPKSK